MRLYVGLTDSDWYRRLSACQPDEVNFWRPGGAQRFSSLQKGELFLFKLKAPFNVIVGGGFFVSFSFLPVSLAWDSFGEKNGVDSLHSFQARIRKYQPEDRGPDPQIGNIILTQPFWLPKESWIPAPADWPKSTVQGKSYDLLEGRGFDLYTQVSAAIAESPTHTFVRELTRGYDQRLTNVRLGQGAFRVLVTEAYGRRCAITGENTLPVLEAAHIKPFSTDGPHELENGMLLRSDMHKLFDLGLLTVTPDLRIEVSSHIREQYANGKRYYEYQGQELKSVPSSLLERPSKEFLDYHNEKVFRP